MMISTTMTQAVIDRYNVMMWNNGEDIYTVSAYGENMMEVLWPMGDDLQATGKPLDAAYLINDCSWQIEKQERCLEDDEAGACNQWYKDGDRDERTMNGLAIYRKERKRIAAWKREFKAWQKFAAANVCEPRDIDLEDIEIKFGKDGKAVC